MNTISQSANSENWEQTIANSGYSFSEVEKYMKESYQKGYDDKGEELKNKISEIFDSNSQITNKLTIDLFNHLKELDLKPINAFLKVESIFNFSIIVTVSLEDYISEKLLKAYNWTNETEKILKNDNYRIDISFMYDDENLNVDCLNSDGYRFKHKSLSGH